MAVIDDIAEAVTGLLAHHQLHASDDVVVVLNDDDRIVLVSRAVEALGWRAEELVGELWADVVGDVNRPPDARTAPDQRPSPPHDARPVSTTSMRCADGSTRPMDVATYRTIVEPHGGVAVLVLTAVTA